MMLSSASAKKLLVTFPPNPDESFLGYLVRLSERNHYETPQWILQVAGVDHTSYEYMSAILFKKNIDLHSLAQTVGVTAEQLEPLIYPPVTMRGRTHMHQAFGMPIPRYLIREQRPKICPACLEESPYLRRVWELVPVTACPIHRQLLLDTCPSCGKAIRWYRKNVTVCRCGYDFRQANSAPVPEEELGLTRLVYRACGLPIPEAAPTDSAENNPLRGVDLDTLSAAVLFVATQIDGDWLSAGERISYSMRNENLHRFLAVGFDVFKAWPENFFRFLDLKRKSKTRSTAIAGLTKDFGQSYKGLYTHLKHRRFEFIRKAFKKYIFELWDGEVLAKRSRLNKSCRTHGKRYVNAKEAGRELKIHEFLVARLIRNGILKGTFRQRGKTSIYIIERSVLREFKRRLDRQLPTGRAAEVLGISEKMLVNLSKNGLLQCNRAIFGVRGLRNSFDQADLDKFLTMIAKRVRKLPKGTSCEEVSFHEAFRKLTPLAERSIHLVKAAIEGELIPCGMREGRGLERLVFKKDDVLAFLTKKLREQRGGMLSLRAAAHVMQMTPREVVRLNRHGFLGTKKVSYNRNEICYVDTMAINQFHAEYVTTAVLARELGTNHRTLIRLLGDIGVTPVTGRKENLDLPYLWSRSELALLDLPALVSKFKKVGKHTYKRESRLLGSKQAMEMLGLRRRAFDDLIEEGSLSPYRSKTAGRGRGKKLLFTRFEVQRCKNRLTDPSGMISARQAATMLDENLSWFYKKWVYTGRMKTIESDDKLRKYLFQKLDVEAAVALKKTTVTGPEAAKILRVHRTAIVKWTEAGILVPISGPHIDGFGCNLYLKSDVEKMAEERAKKSPHAA